MAETVLAAAVKRLGGSSSPILCQQAVVGVFHILSTSPAVSEDARRSAITVCLRHSRKVRGFQSQQVVI
jgi:hypothetical protein